MGGEIRSWAGALAVLAAATTLSACSGTLTGDPHFLSSVGTTGDFVVPIASLQARKFNTVVRQQYDFSCGSAAIATLLHYHYGDPQGEADVFRGMWAGGDQNQIRKVGFSLLDMKRYLATRGMRADGYKVTLADIRKRGIPGVVLITIKQYRHFVVLKGINKDEVLIGDPSLGLRTMRIDEFQKVWNGIYFVINNNLGAAQRAFNVDSQWASFSRSPIGGTFLQPMSQQALSLSAPYYTLF